MDEAQRFWDEEYLPRLSEWLESGLPEEAPLPSGWEAGDVRYFGVSAMTYNVLDEVQDDVVDELLWEVPWPATDGTSRLPMSCVEVEGEGVVVGYKLGEEWVLKSPVIPVPAHLIEGTGPTP